MDVEKLISEVFARKPLWDRQDKNHHNRFVLDELWDEVSRQLNTTRIKARKKWKTLRDKFRSVLADSNDDSSSNYYKYQWKYFQNLSFLKDQFKSKPSGGNLTVTDEDADLKDYLDENETLSALSTTEIDPLSPEMSANPATPSSSHSAESHRDVKNNRKRPASEDLGSVFLEVEKKKMQYLERTRLEQADEDDDLHFFKSLLPHVNKLAPYDKMSYRMEILRVTQNFLKPSHTTEGGYSGQLYQPNNDEKIL